MKKKILGAVLSVGAIVGLASCTEAHQHEFSKEWSSNAGGHWHACECDDRIHDSFAAHTDANKDGKCDVCTFAVEVVQEKEEHKHSYAEAWTSNAQGHWHACECDANVMGSFAGHVDENNDGKCDVCTADVAKQHEHTYATEWSKDEANHWHESTCDHKVVADKAAHTIGNDGTCSTCGYGGTAQNVATLKGVDVVADKAKTYYNIGDELSTEGVVVYETYSNTLSADTVSSTTDLSGYTVEVEDKEGNLVTGAFAAHGVYTVTLTNGTISDSYQVSVIETVYESVADAFEVGAENNDKIASGSVTIDYLDADYVQNIEYAFGDNYTLVTQDGDEQHYQILEDGTCFHISVTKYEDMVSIYAYHDEDPANMNGVTFSTLFNYEDVMGTSELLEKLIEMAASEAASNYKESLGSTCACEDCTAHAAYKFSFDYAFDDANNSYEVAFTLDDASKTIDMIQIKVTSESEGYNWETDEYETYTTVKLVTVKQTAGEKNAENPYNLDELTYQSFDIVDASEQKLENNSKISTSVGQNVYLYIENATPSTALPSIDEIQVNVTNEDGTDTYYAGGSFDSYENYIYLYAYKPGKYNVEIKSTNVTYNYVLSVEFADLEEFNVGIYDSSYYEYVEKSEITVYQNAEVDFKAVVNSNANDGYTATLAQEYANVSFEEGYENNYLFSTSEVGVYVITLTSTEDSTMTATLTITVVETPSVADILIGTYRFNSPMMGTVTYEFTPESEGASNGSLHIVNVGSQYVMDGEGFFTYEFTGGSLVVTPANAGSSRYMFSASLNSDLQVVCLYNFYEQGVCEKVEASTEDEEPSSPLIGTFNAAVAHPMTGRDQAYSVTFNEDGTGSYAFQDYYQMGSFTYTFEDGVITFTSLDADGTVVALEASIDGDSLTITYTFAYDEENTDSSSVTFTVEGLSNDDSNEEETPSEGGIQVTATKFGNPYVYTAEVSGNYTFTVDGSVAEMGYNYDLYTTVSVFLNAGNSIELVMLSTTGNEETITLNVEFEEVNVAASDFATAITQNWICEVDSMDIYFLAFDGDTFTLANRFMGTMSTGTYSYSHDGEGNISFEFVDGDDLIYSMYGPFGTVKFNDTFTGITIGGWNFVIYE